MRIGTILKKWRLINEIPTQELASSLGVSIVTLNRIEAGNKVDSQTLLRLLNWLFNEPKGTGTDG